MFFNSIQIRNALYKCKEQFNRLQQLISRGETSELVDIFSKSMEQYDTENINAILEEVINREMNTDSLGKSLILFVNQFPELNIVLEGKTTEEKILEISRHSAEIRGLINGGDERA